MGERYKIVRVRKGKALGSVIRDMRRQAGMSQEEFAHRANIHRTYVSQIERGLKSPTMTMMEKLAKALGTTPSRILRQIENSRQGF